MQKPQNILMDEHTRPKICDFGLSKTREHTLTHQGIHGTAPYMVCTVECHSLCRLTMLVASITRHPSCSIVMRQVDMVASPMNEWMSTPLPLCTADSIVEINAWQAAHAIVAQAVGTVHTKEAVGGESAATAGLPSTFGQAAGPLAAGKRYSLLGAQCHCLTSSPSRNARAPSKPSSKCAGMATF